MDSNVSFTSTSLDYSKTLIDKYGDYVGPKQNNSGQQFAQKRSESGLRQGDYGYYEDSW